MNTLHMTKKSITIILALVVLLSVAAPVMGREAGAASDRNMPVVSSQAQGPTDPAEMEAFMDELMAKDLEERHIPGAAVSIVKDGVLFFAKGYGYADLDNKIPVDAEQTIF